MLRRAFVLDNRSTGATLDGQSADLQFGNLLAARNEAPPGSGAISGASIRLANATIIADNDGGNCAGSARLW